MSDYPTTTSQVINCATQNLDNIVGMRSVVDSLYELDLDYKDRLVEIDSLLASLHKETEKAKLDAEITQLTDRRNALND